MRRLNEVLIKGSSPVPSMLGCLLCFRIVLCVDKQRWNSINVSYDLFSWISGKLYQIKHVLEVGNKKPLNGFTKRTVKVWIKLKRRQKQCLMPLLDLRMPNTSSGPESKHLFNDLCENRALRKMTVIFTHLLEFSFLIY